MTKKYYLIEGFDLNNPGHSEFTIQTESGEKNMSHEVCTEGWLGSYNNWTTYARGEFNTIEEAAAEIPENYVEFDDANPYDETIIAVYTRDKTNEEFDENTRSPT